MTAVFSKRPSPFARDLGAEILFITISGHEPKTVVDRPATDADKEFYGAEFRASGFAPPPPVQEDEPAAEATPVDVASATKPKRKKKPATP